MKPPPPVMYTVSADSTHTAFTSGRASACRFSWLQLVPPSTLRSAVALSPTTHTALPSASIPFRSFAVPTTTAVQLAPPSIVRPTYPFVPLAFALHVAPPSPDPTTVPPLPTAISCPPLSRSTRRRLGVPLTTTSPHVPPRSALRHTFPLSPTTTMFQL